MRRPWIQRTRYAKPLDSKNALCEAPGFKVESLKKSMVKKSMATPVEQLSPLEKTNFKTIMIWPIMIL